MDNAQLDTFLNVASKLGALGIAVFFLVAFMKEWIVSGMAYRRLDKRYREDTEKIGRDRDTWREMARMAAPIASQAVGFAESSIDRQKHGQ